MASSDALGAQRHVKGFNSVASSMSNTQFPKIFSSSAQNGDCPLAPFHWLPTTPVQAEDARATVEAVEAVDAGEIHKWSRRSRKNVLTLAMFLAGS